MKNRLARRKTIIKLCLSVLIPLILISPSILRAADSSICARVKIEILQQASLERQAFEAHMRIINGVSVTSLDNVNITIKVTDKDGNPVIITSDPNNTNALFFIQQPTLSGITNVSGSGIVQPSSTADINWLIIPAPGASKGAPEGTMYYVGATLSYSMGGQTQTMEVSPDYVFVKPMPEITLDYFLPTDVYGDDAFTPEVESPVPFPLGVRVRNSGAGTATNFKINSAQPKIVENDQGLLIGFNIESAEVNGNPAQKTLLANFGNIKPNTSAVCRWMMTCTLSGRFINFSADYSHADELGGEVTSLLTGTNTHFLIRDVLVDLPGRDNIRDFLAKDGEVIRVYESENTESVVLDQSASSALTPGGSTYNLATPVTNGFMYVKLSDPFAGQQEIVSVIRSDGKIIKPDNVWLSKSRTGSQPWTYSFNIFDVNSMGSYTITFGTPAQSQKPVLMFIPDQTVIEGNTVSFIVQASSPDGAIPVLSVSGLPARATFTDQKTGTGSFSWPTAIGQSGVYNLTFKAANPSNADLTATQLVKIKVNSIDDTNGNGIPDWWEMKYFGNLDRDGTGSYAGDGISDYQKYLLGLDPTRKYTDLIINTPTAPNIQSPADSTEVNNQQPSLVVVNSTDPGGDALKYTFEIYNDKEMTNLIASAQNLDQTDQTTSWQVSAPLTDHTHYYWRVRATSSKISSAWTYGSFFVNLANEAPGAFRISAPAGNLIVDSISPVLTVNNGKDPDEDKVTYKFRVYTDSNMINLVASADNIPAGGNGVTSWPVNIRLMNNTKYYWKAIAVDEHGSQTESAQSSFTVNTGHPAPKVLAIQSPGLNTKINSKDVDLVADTSANTNAAALTYYFEVDKVNTFDSPALQTSGGLSSDGSTVTWHLSALTDNTKYYWRVKANDGQAESYWTTGSFFINVDNIVPLIPTTKNPGNNSWVSTLTPLLAAVPVKSPDNDAITYRFEVYTDMIMETLLFQKDTTSPQYKSSALTDKQWYYWRVRATDEKGTSGPWSSLNAFYIKDNGVVDAPQITITQPSSDIYLNTGIVAMSWQAADEDNNADITLYYESAAGGDAVQIAGGFKSDDNGGQGNYNWDISTIPEGTYYIYATISDSTTTVKTYASGKVIISRTAPVITANPLPSTYTQPQNIILTTSEDSVIYYTLDGSDPILASPVYLLPIALNSNTIIKAFAVDRAGNQSAVISFAYNIQHEITVRIKTDQDRKLSGLQVYAYTSSGTYINKNYITDQEGIAHFLPDDFVGGNYKFRVDYLGYHYWSDAINIPAVVDVTMIIAEAAVNVNIAASNGGIEGVKVYLFNEAGSYLGIYGVTDASGNVSFNLPVAGRYKLRADIMGSQYWSDVLVVSGSTANNVSVNAGGGTLQVNVLKAAGVPLAGVTTYLYSTAGSYLGSSQVTDSTGKVVFIVPEGSYKVRVDYLGYQFFTPDNVVNSAVTTDFIIAHQDVAITVGGLYQGGLTSIADVSVYLFGSPDSAYTSLTQKTNSSGVAVFNLPQKAYKARVDYMGQQFWSNEFTWQNSVINIPLGDAAITVTGTSLPKDNISIYAFTPAKSYLNVTGKTDAEGRVTLRLPAATYNFRADYDGNQYWSGDQVLSADQSNPVNISTGGGSFSLTVKGNNDPLFGVKCYVYKDTGEFLSITGITDTNGKVTFDLPTGSYKFRVDYLGYQFWSEAVNIPATLDLTMQITLADVVVNVGAAHGAANGVTVYLFSESGSYLGISATTDDSGNVTFKLPAGSRYKIRYDIMGNQYWSDVFVVNAGSGNNVSVNAGGGTLQVNILKAAGIPVTGVKAYLFNQNGSYLGLSQTADSNGRVIFNIPAGTYKVRVDYLGYLFWTPDNTVNANVTTNLAIPHQDVTVTIGGLYQSAVMPFANVNVYLYNSFGSYVSITGKTDATGKIVFSIPQMAYKVRADYMSEQYWSNEFTWMDVTINIPMTDAVVTMVGAGMPRPQVPIYVFNLNKAYLGISAQTNSSGAASFRIPVGAYKFRGDYQSNQFWSDDVAILADQTNNVSISDGGGNFSLKVKVNSDSLVGVKCYAFNSSGAYIGSSGITDANGQYVFALSSGSYKFRVDYMGYQFWTDVYSVPDQLAADFVIAEQAVSVNVNTNYQGTNEPLSGVDAYLFTESGAYVNQKGTAVSGVINFNVPQKTYKVRTDYLGRQFWSDVFQWQNANVTINTGLARVYVQRGGTSITGANVYLFSETGSYLGMNLATDADGKAEFKLPAYPFKFRVDVAGQHYWSSVITVTEGADTNVNVNVE